MTYSEKAKQFLKEQRTDEESLVFGITYQFAHWLDDQQEFCNCNTGITSPHKISFHQQENKKECCEKCKDRDCADEIKRTIGWEIHKQIWSCPCHRGLQLCPKCKEFACQCHTNKKEKIEKITKDNEETWSTKIEIAKAAERKELKEKVEEIREEKIGKLKCSCTNYWQRCEARYGFNQALNEVIELLKSGEE